MEPPAGSVSSLGSRRIRNDGAQLEDTDSDVGGPPLPGLEALRKIAAEARAIELADPAAAERAVKAGVRAARAAAERESDRLTIDKLATYYALEVPGRKLTADEEVKRQNLSRLVLAEDPQHRRVLARYTPPPLKLWPPKVDLRRPQVLVCRWWRQRIARPRRLSGNGRCRARSPGRRRRRHLEADPLRRP